MYGSMVMLNEEQWMLLGHFKRKYHLRSKILKEDKIFFFSIAAYIKQW